MVLPESNGQIKSEGGTDAENKKRASRDKGDAPNAKRPKMNGTSELDMSDNSNSSFKEVLNARNDRRDLIVVNSDSNSSLPDVRREPQLEQQQPKKRGRKKGSKNHRNLLDEAETSFSNKMAVSRGNAKVKTTQELIASIQNKKTSAPAFPLSSNRNRDDLVERAAILTERVSIIDQKLNTNANRYKNSQKKVYKNNSETRNDKVIESGIVVNISSDKYNSASNSVKSDDEVIVVDDLENETKAKTESAETVKTEPVEDERKDDPNVPKSLSIEEALKRLPPIDRSVLEQDENTEQCTCSFVDETDPAKGYDEDCGCVAKKCLEEKYLLGEASEYRARQLHDTYIPGVNGNHSLGCRKKPPETTKDGLYVNVVPNVNTEHLPKNENSTDYSPSENYKKYSISDCADGTTTTTTSDGDISARDEEHTFREWHEVLVTPFGDGEVAKILPYVIID